MIPLLICLLLDVQPRPETPPAKVENAQTNEGYYKVKGLDRGKPYTGVVILKKEGNVYTASYTCGYNHVVAVGIRKGDNLSMGWSVDKGCGVTTLTFQNGTWKGYWTSLPGTLQAQPEEWEFWAPLEKEEE